ncbi:hypothetical protein Tco_1439397 [Tanacetum coccineum]
MRGGEERGGMSSERGGAMRDNEDEETRWEEEVKSVTVRGGRGVDVSEEWVRVGGERGEERCERDGREKEVEGRRSKGCVRLRGERRCEDGEERDYERVRREREGSRQEKRGGVRESEVLRREEAGVDVTRELEEKATGGD